MSNLFLDSSLIIPMNSSSTDFSTSDFLKDANILITGISGHIGSRLAKTLSTSGAKVFGLARGRTKIPDFLNTCTILPADLNDPVSVKSKLKLQNFDFIVNTALPHGHLDNPVEFEVALATARAGMHNLIESLELKNLKKFIHLASSLEYQNSNQAFSEADLLAPCSPRGKIKLAQLQTLQKLWKEFAINNTTLRIFNCYGPGEAQNRLIPTIIQAAFDNTEVRLTSDNLKHDYVYIEDVIQAIFLSLKNLEISGEIFNVGTGVQSSSRQIAGLIENLSNRKIRIAKEIYPASMHDRQCWMADISKAKNFLNFSPEFSLSEGLAETIKYFQ